MPAPSEPEPNQVSAWLKENRDMDVDPISVGKQARKVGYVVESVYRDGKIRKLLKPSYQPRVSADIGEVNVP